MHPPKPTRKQKRRYAIVSFNRDDLAYSEMKEVILENYRLLFGSVGLAEARLLFLKNSDNSLICRINTESLDRLKAVILSITNYKRKNLSGRILLVSGTLKALRAKFFKASSAP